MIQSQSKTRTTPISFFFTLLILLILHIHLSIGQTEYAHVNGSVNYNDTPVVAMVLANGQHEFTNGKKEGLDVGDYKLNVPLNSNGEITLYSFVSGFAPFKIVTSPENVVDFEINMQRWKGRTWGFSLTQKAAPFLQYRDVMTAFCAPDPLSTVGGVVQPGGGKVPHGWAHTPS